MGKAYQRTTGSIRLATQVHHRLCEEHFGVEIPIDRDHILGHCEIDSIRKPFCPGEKFPFDLLIEGVQKEVELPFSDIADHWAKDDIIKLYDAGLVSGYPDGTFKPYHFVTRAEMASVIRKLLEK